MTGNRNIWSFLLTLNFLLRILHNGYAEDAQKT